jgi:hypothetical protein
MAILLASTLVLVQLLSVGRAHAWKADQVSRAQLLCQTKLNELLAGIAPLESVEDQIFDEDPNWSYSVEVQPLDVAGLVSVRVTVSPVDADTELTQPSADSPPGYHLVRWMPQAPLASGNAPPSAEPTDMPEEQPWP